MVEIKARAITYAVRTRAQRRSALADIARQLARVREAEARCLRGTPANLSDTRSHHEGEMAANAIGRAMDLAANAYGYRNAAAPANSRVPF